MALLPQASFTIADSDGLNAGYNFGVEGLTDGQGVTFVRFQGENGLFTRDAYNQVFESGKTYIFVGSHPVRMADQQAVRVIFSEQGVGYPLSPDEGVTPGDLPGSSVGGVPVLISAPQPGQYLGTGTLPNGSPFLTLLNAPVPTLQAVLTVAPGSNKSVEDITVREVYARNLAVVEIPPGFVLYSQVQPDGTNRIVAVSKQVQQEENYQYTLARLQGVTIPNDVWTVTEVCELSGTTNIDDSVHKARITPEMIGVTQAHNLGVAGEFIGIDIRDATGESKARAFALSFPTDNTYVVNLADPDDPDGANFTVIRLKLERDN